MLLSATPAERHCLLVSQAGDTIDNHVGTCYRCRQSNGNLIRVAASAVARSVWRLDAQPAVECRSGLRVCWLGRAAETLGWLFSSIFTTTPFSSSHAGTGVSMPPVFSTCWTASFRGPRRSRL